MIRDFDIKTSSKFLAHGEGTDTVQELNLSAQLSLGGFRIYPKSTPLVAGFQRRKKRDYSLHSTVCILQSALRRKKRDYSLHSSVGTSRVVTTVCNLQSAFYSLHSTGEVY